MSKSLTEEREPLLPRSAPGASGLQPALPYIRPSKQDHAIQRQPKRTTKTAQKLTLFPDGHNEEEEVNDSTNN
jgi:hypothetical protein